MNPIKLTVIATIMYNGIYCYLQISTFQKFLLMWCQSCHIFGNSKNITLISEFTMSWVYCRCFKTWNFKYIS